MTMTSKLERFALPRTSLLPIAAWTLGGFPVGWNSRVTTTESQEAVRREARREHDLVDVLVVDPSPSLPVRRAQPEPLDLRPKREVFGELGKGGLAGSIELGREGFGFEHGD